LSESYKQQYFMGKGLSPEEIVEAESIYVHVEDEVLGKDGGENTQDNIFILSYAESKKYLEPLELLDIEETYWLRNPSGTNGLAAATCKGDLDDPIYDTGGSAMIQTELGVRPSIWVTTNATAIAYLEVEAATEYTKNHYNGGSGSCPTCGGSGKVKYYYGGSELEAALNGQDNFSYGNCGSCGGSGRK